MSMHVVYLKDHDGHKANNAYYIERTLGRRLCEGSIAMPYSKYMEKEEARIAEKARKKVESEEKAKAEEARKNDLLKNKKTKKRTAVSGKQKRQETAEK